MLGDQIVVFHLYSIRSFRHFFSFWIKRAAAAHFSFLFKKRQTEMDSFVDSISGLAAAAAKSCHLTFLSLTSSQFNLKQWFPDLNLPCSPILAAAAAVSFEVSGHIYLRGVKSSMHVGDDDNAIIREEELLAERGHSSHSDLDLTWIGADMSKFSLLPPIERFWQQQQQQQLQALGR